MFAVLLNACTCTMVFEVETSNPLGPDLIGQSIWICMYRRLHVFVSS